MKNLKQITFERRHSGELKGAQKKKLYNVMKTTVVTVEGFHSKSGKFIIKGTGVFVSPQGHVLTLSSVVSYPRIQVTTSKGEECECTKVIVDNKSGLAILKLNQCRTDVSYAKLYDGQVNNAEIVYPIGSRESLLPLSLLIGRVSHSYRRFSELKKSFELGFCEHPYRSGDDIDGGSLVCHVTNLLLEQIGDSVSFIQLNNVHGMGDLGNVVGCKGMPIFNHNGHIVGLYYTTSYDQCFAIHPEDLKHFTDRYLPSDKVPDCEEKSTPKRKRK